MFAGLRDYISAFAFHDTWTFDGAWQRRQPNSQPPWRVDSRLVYDDNRAECVLFGGSPISAPPFADTWLWDGVSWQNGNPPTSPPARSAPWSAFDRARGYTLLHGGTNATTS